MTKNELDLSLTRYAERTGHSLSVKAVLFDMDGVLYDSMKHHERSWLETAQANGLSMSQHDVYMFEGQTGPQTINILMERTHQRKASQEEIKSIYAMKTRLFTSYNTGELIPNASKVVEAVKDYKRVIVTGSSQASLLDKLEENYPHAFCRELMVTGLDVTHGKPHPEPYQRGLALAGVAPYEGIVIENAPQGVAAAHAAGCFTIAVNTGPLDDSILYHEGADIVFPDMQSLLVSLPHLLKS